MKQEQLKNQLENLIDSTSLAEVLEAISQVCYEKELHIEENWQDPATAKNWKHAGLKISNISDKVAC